MSDYTIALPEPGDKDRWRRLWADYCSRYDVVVTAVTTDEVWRRILDPAAQTKAFVARDADGQVVGFCHYVLHDHTWAVSPLCFLEDMYVDPAHRRHGVARGLLDRLVAQAREQGWPRVYWHTRVENAPARALYDQVTGGADPMVRYTVRLDR